MSKTILFSPVGGSDPMSESLYRDGSMIHITRKYHPDKIVLYMSREILEKHRKDNRYCYCLNELAKRYNWDVKEEDWIEIIEKEDLTKVQEFDFFYGEFSKIIKSVMEKMDPSDKLLLNVSSGTPAMKSALFVISSLGNYDSLCIQVSTPVKGMTEHVHSQEDYCVEERWELNEDNQDDYEDRCQVCECTNLIHLKQEELIKRLISEYDYTAALSVANMPPISRDEKLRRYLSAAAARMSLDRQKVIKLLSDASAEEKEIFLPVQGGDICKGFEYILTLDIRLKKKQYADFLRAMTPAVYDLFKLILRKKAKFQVEEYIRERNGMEYWSKEKLSGTKYDAILQKAYSHFDYKWVKSDHLLTIIKEVCSGELVRLSEDIRQVEETARNIAAHKIVPIMEEEIEQWTALKPKEIMKKIKKAVGIVMNIKIDDKKWDSYDEMNRIILEIMK